MSGPRCVHCGHRKSSHDEGHLHQGKRRCDDYPDGSDFFCGCETFLPIPDVMECPRCEGNGRGPFDIRSIYDRCILCGGSGLLNAKVKTPDPPQP